MNQAGNVVLTILKPSTIGEIESLSKEVKIYFIESGVSLPHANPSEIK